MTKKKDDIALPTDERDASKESGQIRPNDEATGNKGLDDVKIELQGRGA